MNRKIALLPLTAALLLGLASCGDNGGSSTIPSEEPPATSTVESEPEVYDGGVSDIEPGVDCAISGIVAQIGTKGWTIDDGKAAAYVYGAIDSSFKVGDHVTVTGSVQGYYGLYEITKATVAKSDKPGPTLAAPTELTAAIVNEMLPNVIGKASSDATWAPTNSKRYKLTNVTAIDVAGYPGFTIDGIAEQDGVTPKLASYYYDASKNETAANVGTPLYVGCKYDVSFYFTGTSAAKNVNLCIFDATSHFDPIESLTLDKTTADVEVGKTTKLSASVLPATADQTVTWSTSDAEVATVSKGTVTGVKEGTATITATSGDKTATCTITVKAASVAYETLASLSYNKDTTVVIDNQLTAEEDPHITYTSTGGVSIEVRKNTSSSDVNVWKSDYSSCRWYVGHKVTISHATAFRKIVLTCDSGYADPRKNADTPLELPEGCTLSVDSEALTVTFEFTSAVNSFDLIPAKQTRPSNVELFKVAA